MLTNPEIWSALSFYALTPDLVQQVEPARGGWSGSRVWRIRGAGDRNLCLRCWPVEHPTQERLAYIHDVLQRVATRLPIVPAPLPGENGATFIRRTGRLWELTPWMPGEADLQTIPTMERLRAAMQALAKFHLAAADHRSTSGIAPAWLDRQQRVEQLHCGGLSEIETAVSRSVDPAIDAAAHRILPLARAALERVSMDPLLSLKAEFWLQPAIRDIHREHVLFTGNEVTGIIDFGALRIDTPLADIARLVGSFVGDDSQSRDFALDSYAELRPLTVADRRWIEFFDTSGQVLAAFNWLRWLYVERRDMGPPEPIVRRLAEIESRLLLF